MSLDAPCLEPDGQVDGLTVSSEVLIAGRGCHSGLPCSVRVTPALAGTGIVFTRGQSDVPATWQTANAEASDRRTVLIGETGERFELVEHLMAALAAMGITDARVFQEGPEVPFLGGGSKEFMDALRGAGSSPTGGSIPRFRIAQPVTFRDGGAMFYAAPGDGLLLSAFVEFPGTVVGSDGFSLEISEDSFYREASPARTFALAKDLEMLRQAGLIKGGDLSNAVVFDHERYYNESLHFSNEVVRHKIIDLLGDLALLNVVLRGHVWAWRAGHRSHVRFVQHLAKELSVSHVVR